MPVAIRPKKNFTLKCGGFSLALGERTHVMGILNRTPDSFSDGGRFPDADAAVGHALSMMGQGADIIDVGGESTRPGAEPVGTAEELERVIPVIEALSAKGAPISVDTRKPEVARKALEAGAGMLNLVGGIRDDEMGKVAAASDIPVILTHMRGEPKNMQADPQYDDVMDDIVDHLAAQIKTCTGHGLARGNIIVDPGIGFGKTVDNNREVLRRLGELRMLGAPVMVGTSRKSFIGKITGAEVGDRLEGSLASMVLAAAWGADIVRTHDIRETKRALAVADSILHKH